MGWDIEQAIARPKKPSKLPLHIGDLAGHPLDTGGDAPIPLASHKTPWFSYLSCFTRDELERFRSGYAVQPEIYSKHGHNFLEEKKGALVVPYVFFHTMQNLSTPQYKYPILYTMLSTIDGCWVMRDQ